MQSPCEGLARPTAAPAIQRAPPRAAEAARLSAPLRPALDPPLFAPRLVGVARVPRVEQENDWWTNLFLMLPTDALAVMDARFEFAE